MFKIANIYNCARSTSMLSEQDARHLVPQIIIDQMIEDANDTGDDQEHQITPTLSVIVLPE